MFRGQEVIRQDYVYSLAVLGIVQSRESLTIALTSAWQTAYGMSSVQTVYCILAASKGWIKQTYQKIMHTQNTLYTLYNIHNILLRDYFRLSRI